MDYNQGIVYGPEYWLQCIGNDGGNIRILKSFPQVDSTHSHTGAERYKWLILGNKLKLHNKSFVLSKGYILKIHREVHG